MGVVLVHFSFAHYLESLRGSMKICISKVRANVLLDNYGSVT